MAVSGFFGRVKVEVAESSERMDCWILWEAVSFVQQAEVIEMPMDCWCRLEGPVVAAVVVAAAVAGRTYCWVAATRMDCSSGRMFAVVAWCFVEAGMVEHRIDRNLWFDLGIHLHSRSESRSAGVVRTDCSRSQCSEAAAEVGCRTSPQLAVADIPGCILSAVLGMAQECRQIARLRSAPQVDEHGMLLPPCSV